MNILNETEISERVETIADAIIAHENELGQRIGLMDGKTGTALFFFYYGRITGKEKYIDFAVKLISEVFTQISEGFGNPTLYGGFSGIGLALSYLYENGFLEPDEESLEALDRVLVQIPSHPLFQTNFSYFHGLPGIGLYLLKRFKTHPMETHDAINQILSLLEKNAVVKGNEGIAWESVVDYEAGTKGIHLGLANGMAGIIDFLSRLSSHDSFRVKAFPLLKRAVNFLMKQSQSLDSASIFPVYVGDNITTFPGRLTWADGDPGIGAALWLAGMRAESTEWKENALNILKHTSGRRDYREEKVWDAGLWQGSSGLVMIFNRMYLYTKDERFKETAQYWLNHTLGMGFNETFWGKYKFWNGNPARWQSNSSFIEGISGIGMTLLSGMINDEPVWDEFIFLS